MQSIAILNKPLKQSPIAFGSRALKPAPITHVCGRGGRSRHTPIGVQNMRLCARHCRWQKVTQPIITADLAPMAVASDRHEA